MENLLPIGRFSRMCRLSIPSLRRYDDAGLLVPAWVDPSSGYRYYTYAQANQAEAIRVLRTLDMPLDDIREALASGDIAVAAKVLDRHRARLEDQLDRQTRMLAFLHRLINRKEGVMPYDVVIKQLPAQHVATLRRHTTMDHVGRDMGEGYGVLAGAVRLAGGRFAGPPFSVTAEVFAAESGGEMLLGTPVVAPFPAVGDVVTEEQPDMTVASTVHHGPYDEIGPAYHVLLGWIHEHGHEAVGPMREVYLTDPGTTPDPADYVTEVQVPIA